MRATETVSGVAAFEHRGAGTDSERRAARWLANEASSTGRDVIVEPFWCRPNWALAHAWHVALGIAGSLASVASGITGAALLGAALVSVLLDAVIGVSPGRRLTPERASQNVIAVPPQAAGTRTRVVLTANYDAARRGLVYRDGLRSVSALLRRATRGATPGWLGWLVIALLWLLALAVLRATGHHAQPVGAIQLPPTVALVIGLALLLELATAEWSPSAGDNATGVAVALTLARALDASPPARVDVDLVLTGAGDSGQLGLRRYLRARRGERAAGSPVVLGFAACSGGTPRWWKSDGALLPLRFARPLRQLAAEVASEESHLAAAQHLGRGTSVALPARAVGLPSITIGCLDGRDLAPRSHHKDDTPDLIDPHALDAAVQFGLLLIDGIDAAVADGQGEPSATPA